MKAVRIVTADGIDGLKLVDIPDPGSPGYGEMRVRIHATSLNYHDYGVVRRGRPQHIGIIPMADGAGVVEAVGDGVAEFAVGDHVVSTFFPDWLDGGAVHGDFTTVPGDGRDGYAQEVVVRPSTWFTHAPEGWSHAEAATLTTAGLTAWRALVGDAGLKAGDIVLATGTGGVSIIGVLLAKSMGAETIVTSSSDEKLARATALGIDHVINYRKTPHWGAEAVRLTGGRGVDHALELGGPGTLPQTIEAVRVGGHISLIGTVTGHEGAIPTAKMMVKQQRLQGLIVGSRRQQLDMVKGLNQLAVRPVIDRTFPLAELADAFRHQESAKHFGKICVEC